MLRTEIIPLLAQKRYVPQEGLSYLFFSRSGVPLGDVKFRSWVGEALTGLFTHFNHSKDFWQEVELYVPKHRSLCRWLRENGPSLKFLSRHMSSTSFSDRYCCRPAFYWISQMDKPKLVFCNFAQYNKGKGTLNMRLKEQQGPLY